MPRRMSGILDSVVVGAHSRKWHWGCAVEEERGWCVCLASETRMTTVVAVVVVYEMARPQFCSQQLMLIIYRPL